MRRIVADAQPCPSGCLFDGGSPGGADNQPAVPTLSVGACQPGALGLRITDFSAVFALAWNVSPAAAGEAFQAS